MNLHPPQEPQDIFYGLVKEYNFTRIAPSNNPTAAPSFSSILDLTVLAPFNPFDKAIQQNPSVSSNS